MKATGLFVSGNSVDLCFGLVDNRSLIVSAIFIPALLIATFTDLRNGKIYDRLNYPLMLVALLMGLAEEWQAGTDFLTDSLHAGGLRSCMAGGLVCFGLMFFNYIVAGGGGGDVKLATALGMGFGMISGVNILILTYLLGAIHVGCCYAFDSLRFARWRIQGRDSNSFVRHFSGRSQIRMAPFFLMATLITVADAWI